MNEIVAFSHSTQIMLFLLEQQCGELKLLSSRATEETSRSIDEVIETITVFLRSNPRFGIYNIQLFKKDSNLFETRHIISISAICYNYFLLNTNFPSQHLFEQSIISNIWPTLSPYLFIQIIWLSKCEDLLIESLVHIPLDLCVEVLEITIKHIDELEISRARRLVFLLIYKIYYRCLWLHLGTLSEQNVYKRIYQLLTHFEMLLTLLVSPKFVTSHNSSIEKKYLLHGILVKNILYYTKKCMHSKIESFSENHNLADLFMLTYGNSTESTNYYHMLPAKEVKSIIMKLDQHLTTVLLNQIKHVDSSEFITWENINDDENTMISLQRAIVMECHYFMEFIKQHKFLAMNEDLFHYLQRLVGPRKPEEAILTLQELCHGIAKDRPNNMKELIKRYKEWDLSILDFINERIELLRISDVFVILEYLHHTFTYLHTKAEKYKLYVSVLKILIQLTVQDLHSTVQDYVKRHFDDNPLEYLYSEEHFVEFIEGRSPDEFREVNESIIAQELRIILIFILLNPKDVLSKLVMYEIDRKFNGDLIFSSNMSLVRSYYYIKKGRYNLLMYILKDIVFQQRVVCNRRFKTFLDNVINYQMMTADDILNEIYITYLFGSYFEKITLHVMLSHMYSILQRKIFTNKTNFVLLIIALIKTISLLRCYTSFSRSTVYKLIKRVNNILGHLRLLNILTDEQNNMIYVFGVEPLEMMNKLWPMINTMHVIKEYERRCFVVHQRLRTDPRCHPKLRNFVQSFTLDRETFIRHMMLHSFKIEYDVCVMQLTFTFFNHFGWASEIIAYENVMRITAEASQIALMYIEMFPKHTFIGMLFNMVRYCNLTADMCKNYETIRHILLKTLSSMNHVVSRTQYGIVFNHLVKRIQETDPYLQKIEYFKEIQEWIHIYVCNFPPQGVHLANKDCICDKNMNCKNSLFIEKKIVVMYNAYLFTRECIKLSSMEDRYSEQLLQKLYLAG